MSILKTLQRLQTAKRLDALVDKVLAYRPKPKSKATRKRRRKAAKLG